MRKREASRSRSIVPLRGGKRFSQDIVRSVAGMPDRKLTSVYIHAIVTRFEYRSRVFANFDLISTENQSPYMDFINQVERR